ncbi:hypothetical protein LMG19146_03509 [Xanthomonas arboricola pv. fragariae]|nr:hypothetical protein LMG19146_03509 [Xanthomonas arboricola pv. fragariae]
MNACSMLIRMQFHCVYEVRSGTLSGMKRSL